MREPEDAPLPPAGRRLFTNRTLNLRSIGAIGFDMDYTLVHYDAEAWEQRAYQYVLRRLVDDGWPVGHLRFDPELVTRGLLLDLDLGNVVKANRFGFVKRAAHGTRMMSYEDQRKAYSRVLVDLREPRWVFMNTFFSLSEACLYAQLVDLLDAGGIEGVLGYRDVYEAVRGHMDHTHVEGELKAEIVADPDRFVVLDEELPLALRDLRHAGKKLALITNSEWAYTRAMMSHALDRYVDAGWRSLFDLVIVSARKPGFFTGDSPAFEVVDDEGLLRPVVGPLRLGGAYVGGHAAAVEALFGLPGEQVLYVGDHIFADVNVSKSMLRWRTGLVLRELEAELDALDAFNAKQAELTALMADKELLEHRFSRLRLLVQRADHGYGPPVEDDVAALRARMTALRETLVALDERIAPLAAESGCLVNERWGLLLRSGNDKSHLARQIERYADVYTSRVSNLLHVTPFVYLRSPRGSLPHDGGPDGGTR